ncbi:MAG: hydroxymethylglutaryl-CoA reductase, degradative [Deltaproteobacteria bacterium]|nr:hydroxymethylglutaryl-CoA reductase, degradative [Deltaproteobacteria bacterium]
MSTKAAASSRITGFYRLDRDERLQVVRAAAGLGPGDPALDGLDGDVDVALLDGFVENVIGAFPLPLGIAVNFQVDGRDLLVPMAVEESSVVAAASNMARLARNTGGFQTEVVEDLVIGQIQVLDVADGEAAAVAVASRREEIIEKANALDPTLVSFGGGCRDVECRIFSPEQTGAGTVLVVHLLVDPRDAMGANVVNTMAEALAPDVARWAGGRPGLRILSNLADRRRFRATCRIRPADLAIGDLPGPEVAQRIVEAARFAWYDSYRAATHNKGIMNGIDPVVVVTGNDWRAVEAGVHAYAARDGQYRSVSSWTIDDDGMLVGQLEVPLQVGIVGGVTRLHPTARFALRLLRVETAQDLARVLAAVGLAQNLGALRALGTEGIQKGHMRLHARNLELASDLSDEPPLKDDP